jgi:tetratricopeptide (TPR) repeat protein
MSTNVEDTIPLCRRCGKRPASTTFTNRTGAWSERACEFCFDRFALEDAMGWGIVDASPLVEAERWDDILAWLDELLAANRHRDHDGWLARSVASHRELTLWQAGRFEEALAACDVVDQLGFEDDWYRYAAGSSRASVLESLGRHAEALAVFEEASRYHDPRAFQSLGHLMVRAVEYSANASQPVNESWREVAQNVATHYGVEFPVRPTLAESITELFAAIKPKLQSGMPELDEDE